jgi:hypothetical protein
MTLDERRRAVLRVLEVVLERRSTGDAAWASEGRRPRSGRKRFFHLT